MEPDRHEFLSAHPAEIETLLERVQRQQLSEQDFRLLERLLRLLLSVARLLAQKQTSLARLKRLLFGPPRIRLRPLLLCRSPAPIRSQLQLKRSIAVMAAGAALSMWAPFVSAAPIHNGKRAIGVAVAVGCITHTSLPSFSASRASLWWELPVMSKLSSAARVVSNVFRLPCRTACRQRSTMPRPMWRW